MTALTESARRLAEQRERHRRILRNLPENLVRGGWDRYVEQAPDPPIDAETLVRDLIDDQIAAHGLTEMFDQHIAYVVGDQIRACLQLGANRADDLTQYESDQVRRTSEAFDGLRALAQADLEDREHGPHTYVVAGLMQLADRLADLAEP